MTSSTSAPWASPETHVDPPPCPGDSATPVRVLLVDDDEDYYILTADLLQETGHETCELEWASTYEKALTRIRSREHDVYLIDYRLGAQSGLDLMNQAQSEGFKVPFIMLTGQGDREIDLRAMQSGAADYLVKGQIEAQLLERSIRYAIRRTRILQDMSRLVAILEATTDFVSTSDAKGRVTYINRAGRRMVGLDEDENVMGMPLDEFHPAWAARLIREDGLIAARQDGAWSRETALLSRAGREIPVSQLILTHRDENGQVEYYSTIARDISAQLIAHEAETRLATAIEQVADSILITDIEGVIEYVNPAFAELTGYAPREAVGQHTRILKSGVHKQPLYQDLWDTILAGCVWVGRLINKKKDGSTCEVDVTITPVRGRDGNVINFVAAQRDATQEREMELRVQRAQRMEAVGQLAGGVAHDFNNLLTVISGFSALLTDSIQPGDERGVYVEEIREASERAAQLTRQLLAFGRRQVLQPKIVNLNRLIQGMNQMLRKLIGEHTELRTVLNEELLSTQADPSQLEQVLVNMVLNACHAMKHGGGLTLETYNYQSEEPLTSMFDGVTLDPGRYVVLAITDTGTGMPEEVKARAFEPFFTTKDKDKGTGLGLATCFGIIKQSGGDIHLYSELGYGTTFRIYLPAVPGRPSDTTLRRRPGPCALQGTETILVVEDEGTLRELASSVLRTAGYSVFKAANGEDGLRVARENFDEIDLVISDVIMPKMGGGDMVQALKDQGMNANILFMSGYTDDALQHQGVLDPSIEFLAKPFTPEQLNRKVRSVLDG